MSDLNIVDDRSTSSTSADGGNDNHLMLDGKMLILDCPSVLLSQVSMRFLFTLRCN